MPEDKTISVETAAEILKVSPRTVRRYAKERKLVYTYVQGKYGQELRLGEEQVRTMAKALSNGADKGGQHSPDSAVNGSAPATAAIDAATVWKAYEAMQKEYRDVAAQLGYWRSKAEELPKLAERAESLLKEKTEVDQARSELEEQLQREQVEKARLKRQIFITQTTFIALFIVAAVILFLLSPLASVITSAFPTH